MRFFEKARKSGRRVGFTLVELLVTIAIVGLLFSLGSVATTGAMQKARETQCLSNLRQLGIGALAYAADNNTQMLPHAIFDESLGANGENREWCYGYGSDDPENAFKEGILGPYLDDAQKVLADPTFTYKGSAMEMVSTVPPRARPTTFGFGYNGFFLSKKMTGYGQWQGYPLATVEKPDKTVMFATSGEYAGEKVRPYENIWPGGNFIGGRSKRVMRAVDGKNVFVCWVSGHVSKVALVRVQDYKGTKLGQIEGENGENIFDRFDGDTGDQGSN